MSVTETGIEQAIPGTIVRRGLNGKIGGDSMPDITESIIAALGESISSPSTISFVLPPTMRLVGDIINDPPVRWERGNRIVCTAMRRSLGHGQTHVLASRRYRNPVVLCSSAREGADLSVSARYAESETGAGQIRVTLSATGHAYADVSIFVIGELVDGDDWVLPDPGSVLE